MCNLTIVIVNWNACEELMACLASIEQHRGALSVETIVVDNASSDGSLEVIREAFPQVVLIANQDNIGFPRAVNQGLAVSNGEMLLLLNPDTEVQSQTLAGVVGLLLSRPDVGAVGVRLERPGGKICWEGARRLPRIRDLIFDLFGLENLFPRNRFFAGHRMGEWDHRGSRDVECFCGAFLAFRREVLEQVGLLDERLFMYLEDLDYCRRIGDAGYLLHYLGQHAVHHSGQASSQRHPRSVWLTGLNYRAYYEYFVKHEGPIHGIVARLLILAGGVFRLLLLTPTALATSLVPSCNIARLLRRKAVEAAYLVTWSLGAG